MCIRDRENAEQRIYEIRSGRDSSALTPLSSSMVETLTNLQKISGPDADVYKRQGILS